LAGIHSCAAAKGEAMRDQRQRRRPPATPRADRLLTKAEAAERLNVSPRFLERCVAQRRIRFVRVDRFIRVPESAINELVADGTVDVADPAAARRR
jgi:excisionase family DNA binding protein